MRNYFKVNFCREPSCVLLRQAGAGSQEEEFLPFRASRLSAFPAIICLNGLKDHIFFSGLIPKLRNELAEY